MMQNNNESIHIPVLLQFVVNYLDVQPGETVFDGTLGGGSYSREILEYSKGQGWIVATDQDSDAIERFVSHERVEVHHTTFSNVSKVMNGRLIDAAVLDLGISSDQLQDRDRGISFGNPEAPLDMRMNRSADNHLTAWGILNTWEEDEIADIIYRYGDERKSRRIARTIVEQRDKGEMETVGDLRKSVEQAVGSKGKIHPATKTFQALRIVVNDELGELERFLDQINELMNHHGRLVIVSFHSLEDRVVKQQFKEWAAHDLGTIVTKKPITATEQELQENPRSRSAKLRCFEFK